MPLGLDPNETIEITLISDQDAPAECRPTFLFAVLVERDVRQLEAVTARLLAWQGQAAGGGEDDDDEKKIDVEELTRRAAAFDAIRDDVWRLLAQHLIEWQNLTDRTGEPVDFATHTLEHVLTWREAYELFVGLTQGQQLTADAAGNSDSPSGTDTDRSAGADPVPPDGESDAPDDRPAEAPTSTNATPAAEADASPVVGFGAGAEPENAPPAEAAAGES